jgi:hypothetical protein
MTARAEGLEEAARAVERSRACDCARAECPHDEAFAWALHSIEVLARDPGRGGKEGA